MNRQIELVDIGFGVFLIVAMLSILGLGAYGIAYWYTCGVVCG